MSFVRSPLRLAGRHACTWVSSKEIPAPRRRIACAGGWLLPGDSSNPRAAHTKRKASWPESTSLAGFTTNTSSTYTNAHHPKSLANTCWMKVVTIPQFAGALALPNDWVRSCAV